MGSRLSEPVNIKISMNEIIKSASTNTQFFSRKLLNESSPTSSPNSNKSNSSTDSNNSNSEICGSNLKIYIDCHNFDILQDIKIFDKKCNIDHIDLIIGHRRFNAIRDGEYLVIYITIPNFIISNNSPLRLDIYPKTQTNPDEIFYYYRGYKLNDSLKETYMNNRIEDKDKNIMYIDGLIC